MKIVLVGIHSKPDMEPLDSRTKTGQIVDKVIAAFPQNKFVKSNLFTGDHIPVDAQANCRQYVKDWIIRTEFNSEDDIAIVLGNDAKFLFRKAEIVLPLFKEHPAQRQIPPDEYVADVIKILRAYLLVKPVFGL